MLICNRTKSTHKMKAPSTYQSVLIGGVLGAMIFIVLSMVNLTKTNKAENEVRDYLPRNVTTRFRKVVSEKEWGHFDHAVSECRIVIQNNDHLKKRSSFWEQHGIEPAVGYAAWLFQETRFNGHVVGDNGRAHGYGQIHPPALQEVNSIRKKRGVKVFSHNEIRGRSREKLGFFLEALHDYADLCEKRHKRKRSLDADLNAWNSGGGRTTRETKYSGEIKSIILQYYKRKKAKEAKQKKADLQAGRPFVFFV
jgi:hypothetical protein